MQPARERRKEGQSEQLCRAVCRPMYGSNFKRAIRSAQSSVYPCSPAAHTRQNKGGEAKRKTMLAQFMRAARRRACPAHQHQRSSFSMPSPKALSDVVKLEARACAHTQCARHDASALFVAAVAARASRAGGCNLGSEARCGGAARGRYLERAGMGRSESACTFQVRGLRVFPRTH